MANSTLQTDIVIIGGGGAGIPAAIEVARAGGKAVVLEGAAECGGTAAISGGGCCIVGTPLQKSHGYRGHTGSRVRGLGQVGRWRGRRSLGALLSGAHLARSLSLGRELRRQVGRYESFRKATGSCAGIGRTTTDSA